MPKIPVDIDNVQSLKNEATLLCNLARVLLKSRSLSLLTVDKVLIGVSKKLGYSSYGALVACNQQSRCYVPFSLRDITHFRYVASSIAQETGIDEYTLTIIAALLQLGAQSKDDIKFCAPHDEDGPSISLVVAEPNVADSFDMLLSSPKALLAARVATTLKNMRDWLPELVNYIQQASGASDNCVIVTPTNTLSEIGTNLDRYSHIAGYVEIVMFDARTKRYRHVYAALYSGNTVLSIAEVYELAKKCCESIFDTIGIDTMLFPNAVTEPSVWFFFLQNNLMSSDLDITLCIKLIPRFLSPLLSSLSNKIEEAEPTVIQFLRHGQCHMTNAGCQAVTEMRLVANKPYIEAWIVPEVAETLVTVNRRIDEEQKTIFKELSPFEERMRHSWFINGNNTFWL